MNVDRLIGVIHLYGFWIVEEKRNGVRNIVFGMMLLNV